VKHTALVRIELTTFRS